MVTKGAKLMSDQLAKKLLIKPGHRILVRNAPAGYLEKLVPLPEGVQLATTVDGRFDVVLQFVNHKADVDAQALESVLAAREGGVVRMALPNGSKNCETSLNREAGG